MSGHLSRNYSIMSFFLLLLSVGGWVGTDATDARVFSSGTTQGNEPKKEFNETPSSAKINFQSHLWPTAVWVLGPPARLWRSGWRVKGKRAHINQKHCFHQYHFFSIFHFSLMVTANLLNSFVCCARSCLTALKMSIHFASCHPLQHKESLRTARVTWDFWSGPRTHSHMHKYLNTHTNAHSP